VMARVISGNLMTVGVVIFVLEKADCSQSVRKICQR